MEARLVILEQLLGKALLSTEAIKISEIKGLEAIGKKAGICSNSLRYSRSLLLSFTVDWALFFL